MKRKGVKAQQPPAEPDTAKAGDAKTVSLLPMEVQIGDRFTDHDFEWEVLTRPAALHGGKSLRARIRRPGLPRDRARGDMAGTRAGGDPARPADRLMPPFLLPWVRVLLLIRDIRSTTWGHERWPQVKPLLRRALEMRREIAREGWWN